MTIEPTLIRGQVIAEYTRTFTSDPLRTRVSKPNIIIILPDEQRADTIGAYGSAWARTPAFDRLAREGQRWRGYTPNPVCIPARHNLLTGLPGRVHGALDNGNVALSPDVPRLPRLLADAGYHCGGIGKFHFTPPPTHHGFHELLLMEEIPRYVRDDQYLQFLRANGHARLRNIHGIRNLLYWQPQRSLVPEEHHGTTWVGDQAVRFIRENERRPFFLQLGFIAPHPPLDVPDRWAEMSQGLGLPPPVGRRSDPPSALVASIESYDAPRPEKVARTRELYQAAVWQVDHQVGRVLAELDRLGLANDTLVIACSDHGDMLGDLGGWSKSLPYEGACAIPMILRWPGRLAPAIRTEFADLNDLLPTCCEAAGIPAPAPAPGESLLMPAGAGSKDRGVQFVEHQKDWRRWAMVRDCRWKFVHWYDGLEELFDLEADPGERSNLLAAGRRDVAGSPLTSLRERLIAYEAQWGPQGCVTDGDFTRFPIIPSNWLPGAKTLEWQFQFFMWGLPEAERLAMCSEGEEVLAAIARELQTRLQELDLAFYLSAGGDARLVSELSRS